MEFLNVPELKKTGVVVGGLLIGSLSTNIGLNQLKKHQLPVSGITCLASGYASHLVKHPLGKSVLQGVSLFSGLKFLSLAVNGTLNGLGEETPVVGLKMIPENVKVQLRKYLPNLGEGGSDYNEMGAETITVESPEIEGVNDDIANIGRLFNRNIQIYKDGQPVYQNGSPMSATLTGDLSKLSKALA